MVLERTPVGLAILAFIGVFEYNSPKLAGNDVIQESKKENIRSTPVSNAQNTGVVYRRTNKKTGESYVGQPKSPERYKKRQKEHKKANPEADYEFEIVGRAKPGIDLDILEQKKINEYGGLKREDGTLENKRHQLRRQRWDSLGIN